MAICPNILQYKHLCHIEFFGIRLDSFDSRRYNTPMNTTLLKFSRGNAKLDALEAIIGGEVWTFSLLSGYTCPFAKDCLSFAVRENGTTHIEDGPNTEFRCFSASQEALLPVVYNARNHNTELVNESANVVACTDLIISSLPKSAKCVRIHVGGDFHKLWYWRAWNDVARLTPDKVFYAYTKSLPFWVRDIKIIPQNMILTASKGGKFDALISKHKLRQSVVVYSEKQAKSLKLEIDHDDSHAALPILRNQSFALLIHGMQPAGSDAGKAVRALNGGRLIRKGN